MPASASPSGSHKPSRLSVNPRRSHVTKEERKRCKIACNGCNLKRVKCSGTQPCDQCTNVQKHCVYPVVEKKIYVPESSYKELRSNNDALELCLRNAFPDPVQRQSILAEARQSLTNRPVSDEEPQGHSPAGSSSTCTMSPAQYQQYNYPQKSKGGMGKAATEGTLLVDHHGTKRWLGGTSGATFLDHLKKFMFTLKSSLGHIGTGAQFLESRGQYQTSDSRLLFAPASDNNNNNVQVANPDQWLAGPRLGKVDEFLQGTGGTSACGGIHYFGDLSLEKWLAVRADFKRPPELAFYEAAFALGTIYSLTATNSRRDGQLGETYFSNARRILGDPMDVSHYDMRDVATLGMMAMYMSEMNRRDNAYMYLSHAITICCMFGGLKGTLVELEEGDKRIIWTLFCLTRDFSCLMGRPPLFPVEAFQLPYPEPVFGLPPPEGLIAHIQLSKIADYIVSNTYGIAPQEGFQDSIDKLERPVNMLHQWLADLPEALQLPFTTKAEESYQVDCKPPDRSLYMLHMKWNQLLILALRPLFFLVVKSVIGADFLVEDFRGLFGDNEDKARDSYIAQCSAAARRNLWLGRHISGLCSPMHCNPYSHGIMPTTTGKLVTLDLHHIFNATVVLLLYRMVCLNDVNTDSIGILFARQTFENEARAECLGASGNATGYASDCKDVLNDLIALVADIRPLRFKDSEHLNTGLDSYGVVNGGSGRRLGSVDHGGGAISTEQLEANLNLENPYGGGGMNNGGGVYHHLHQNHHAQMQVMAGGDANMAGGQVHTNRDELGEWVKADVAAPLHGYTGI